MGPVASTALVHAVARARQRPRLPQRRHHRHGPRLPQRGRRDARGGAPGWPPLPGADLSYVTAGLDVRFLRPAPLHEPVELHAVVTEADEPQMTVAVELRFDGKVRAEATAVWKRWRPRP